MSESRPLVYVVVEKSADGEKHVKAVFTSEEAAREAIEQEFFDDFEYQIEPRTLYESMTE